MHAIVLGKEPWHPAGAACAEQPSENTFIHPCAPRSPLQRLADRLMFAVVANVSIASLNLSLLVNTVRNAAQLVATPCLGTASLPQERAACVVQSASGAPHAHICTPGICPGATLALTLPKIALAHAGRLLPGA